MNGMRCPRRTARLALLAATALAVTALCGGAPAAHAADIGDEPMAEWFGSWSGDIGEATGAYAGAAAAH